MPSVTGYNFAFTTLSEAKISPFYEQIRKSNRDWIKCFKLSNEKVDAKIEQMNFVIFVAMVYPQAKQAHLELFADCVFWLFAFDDMLENVDEVMADNMRKQAISILNEKGFEKTRSQYLDNLFIAWQDLVRRLKLCMNCNSWKRFCQHLTDSIDATSKSFAYRRDRRPISEEEFALLRRNESGSFPCFDLIEIVRDVPDEIFDDKRLQRLIEIAGNNVAWINDIYSLFKDQMEGAYGTISVVQQEKGLTEYEAVNYLYNRVEDEMLEFNEIYRRIKAEPDSNQGLVDYVESLIDWLAGHLEWYKYTRRYTVKEHSLKPENVTQQMKMTTYNVERTKESHYGKEIATESTPLITFKYQETKSGVIFYWLSSIFCCFGEN